MATSFNEQLDHHGAWRREFALRLKLLADWMKDHELLDSAARERLRRLEAQVRSDKVMVAFVAEFSRGKSELINAIFFADYGQRLLPSSVGRTTMCPTELLYDAASPPSIRLLPIETRAEHLSTSDYREQPAAWTVLPLNLAQARCIGPLPRLIGNFVEVHQPRDHAVFVKLEDPAWRTRRIADLFSR